MPTQYTELVGRRAKLTGSADWVGAGWLEVKINPLLPRREIYLAVLPDGFGSGFSATVNIALFHKQQMVWQASGMLLNDQTKLSYTGSSVDWKGTDSPGVNYKSVHYENGLPPWYIQSEDNYTLWPYEGEAVGNGIVWMAATNNGYTNRVVHRVRAAPVEVQAIADTYAFRFVNRTVGFTAPTPSVEVFLACRSSAI